MTRPAVAFVVQRYGPQITGGSESLARALAERLLQRYQITVLTTCATDYVTWRNELPAGSAIVNGVAVERFPVAEERDLEAFNAYSDVLYARAPSTDEERLWLRRQGPYVPQLVAWLEREQARFHAVVFFTYLYYPTCAGLEVAARHAVLVPTTHDEPPLRFSIFDQMFARPRALGFLTPAEERLVRARFPLGTRPASVVGFGIELPPALDLAGFRSSYRVPERYALYAGRIDAGKGCVEMFDHYSRYRQQVADPLDLLLIGRLAMPEPAIPGVRYLGFLSEDEKAAALGAAHVVVCPSPYESLSIVLLEGFALGTPALVNARSEVLKDHCTSSHGGLYYADGDEFAEALDRLAQDAPLHRALAQGGERYVREHYRWPVVLERYSALIEAAAR